MSENFTNNNDFNKKNEYKNRDIDEIQALIKKKMSEDENIEYHDDFDMPETYDNFDINTNYNKNTNTRQQKKSKKYVVTINPENSEFFESLSPEKRVEVVNTVISAYRDEQKITPDNERTKKFIKHLIAVVITLAIGFPLVFYLTNASIEATVNSYREVQNNFEKLYQQKGGVKRKNLSKLQNLQY